jgi:hypothetical protein
MGSWAMHQDRLCIATEHRCRSRPSCEGKEERVKDGAGKQNRIYSLAPEARREVRAQTLTAKAIHPCAMVSFFEGEKVIPCRSPDIRFFGREGGYIPRQGDGGKKWCRLILHRCRTRAARTTGRTQMCGCGGENETYTRHAEVVLSRVR